MTKCDGCTKNRELINEIKKEYEYPLSEEEYKKKKIRACCPDCGWEMGSVNNVPNGTHTHVCSNDRAKCGYETEEFEGMASPVKVGYHEKR